MLSETAPALVVGAYRPTVIAEVHRLGRPVCALERRPPPMPFPPGVEVVVGDLTDPDSLVPALAGVEAVFLSGLRGRPQSRPSSRASREASSAWSFCRRRTRRRTRSFGSPIPWCCSRQHRTRAANTVAWWAPQIRAGDVVRWPYGAVETAPIDERDIAAVAVRALSEASLAGADYVLTGPGALSHARQVEVIGEVLGRRLAFHELSPDDFRRETAATWPPSAVEMLLAAWGAAVGHPAYVTTTVADLTGSPARSLHEWVAAHADSFRNADGHSDADDPPRRASP